MGCRTDTTRRPFPLRIRTTRRVVCDFPQPVRTAQIDTTGTFAGRHVLFGASSGAVPPFDPIQLSQKGSLFLTRPSLAHYAATREELLERAGDVLGWIASGELVIRIDRDYPLEEAADAHRALEGRETAGKVLLIP